MSIKLGVDGALKLMAEGVLDVRKVDHLLCHYSSHHFRSRIYEMLERCGASVPYEKWYTNLYTRGNTGCASIMIMLDEFLRDGRALPGETLLCIVPESGRFNVAYMHMTVVEACMNDAASTAGGTVRACAAGASRVAACMVRIRAPPGARPHRQAARCRHFHAARTICGCC